MRVTLDLKEDKPVVIDPIPPKQIEWNTVVPEPAIPKVKAGESFTSAFGYKVTRITDENTNEGHQFMHYYSDRSPISNDGKWMIMTTVWGATVIQELNGSTPVGKPSYIRGNNGEEIHIGAYMWGNSGCYFIINRRTLQLYNPETKQWALVKDFTKEFEGMPSHGYLTLPFISADEKRFLFDIRTDSKVAHAILKLEDGKVTVYAGTRLSDPHPVPNDTFILVGAGVSDKEGRFITVQMNGTANVWLEPKPANPTMFDWANTFSYIVPWDQDPLGTGYAIAGPRATGHGCRGLKGAALTECNEKPLTKPDGYPDWFFGVSLRDYTGKWSPETGYPYKDVFAHPYSFKMSGQHIGSSVNDEWTALSLYQEVQEPRVSGPLAHEIILVSENGDVLVENNAVVKNGKIKRLAHHYSYTESPTTPGYWNQPHAVRSADGKYVVFTSTFGNNNRTDVFMVEI